MNTNVCINEDFETPTEIATLQQTLYEKCGFDETKVLKTEIRALKANFANALKEIATCDWKVQRLLE